MAKDYEDGVWRTIGGRRIFIKDGQSMSDAMKASGKFKKKALGKGLKDLEQKEPDSEGAKKLFDEDEKKAREAEWEKNIEEQYNRFHGKTDEQIANEIAKERGERILTDEEQKAREVQFMKNLEKEVDKDKNQNKALGKGLDNLGKEKLDGEGTKKLFDNNSSEAEKDYQKYNEWLKSQGVDKQLTEAEYNKMSQETEKINNKGLERSIEMEKDNLARRKQNGDSVENISNKTRNIHELELEKQKSDQRLARLNNANETGKSIEADEDRRKFNQIAKTYGYNKLTNEQIEQTLQEAENKGMYHSKSDIEAMRRYLDRTVIEKDTGSAYSKPGKRWEVLEKDKSAYGKDIYKVRDEEGNVQWKDASSFYDKAKTESTNNTIKTDTNIKNQIKTMTVKDNEGNVKDFDMSKVKKIEDAGNRYEIEYTDGYGSLPKDKVTSINGVDTKKSTNDIMNNAIRRKAYQKYLKEHPNSKMKFEDFIKE